MTALDTPAIDCRNLCHSYGRFTAVDDFSLQVAAGETVGLLGPNGAGKTTVVKVLTTLTPVQGGQRRDLRHGCHGGAPWIFGTTSAMCRSSFRSSRR